VTAYSYLQLLGERFLSVIQFWPEYANIIFMQDGVPPHQQAQVTIVDAMITRHSGSWMVKQKFSVSLDGSYLTQLSCSYFLTTIFTSFSTMYYFLWWWVKSQIYRTPPADLDELQTRIQHVFNELLQDIIDRTIGFYVSRLEKCIQNDGRNVEIR